MMRFFFVAVVVFLGGAAQALEPLEASSSFRLFLRPTFSQLTLEAQSIAAQSISSTVATVGDLRDAYVVIQDATFQGQEGPPRLGSSLQLPATTLTFAVFGSSSSNEDPNYLNKVIINTFSSEDGQAQLIRDLKTKHALYKDLVDIQIWPITTAFGQNSSSEQDGFFQNLNAIEVCVLVMGTLILAGVAYMVIQSHRSTRQEHERVRQVLSSHAAAAVSSLQGLDQDDAGSIASKFAYLKSFMVDRSHGDLIHTTAPKATTNDKEATTDEESMRVSSQESFHSAEHYPNSSSSYHSAQLLGSSQEELASSSQSGESSSVGSLSEFHVIPSLPSEDSQLYLHSQSSFSASTHSDAYSSGMSSAHFSSSRWFQHNGFPTPSEDTFDVFQVDVDKFEAELLMDDAESKTSRTTLFMEHWVKQIQVVPSEKSSVATPDSTETPECASVHSGSQGEIEEVVDCHFLKDQAAPKHHENVETLSPVEEV